MREEKDWIEGEGTRVKEREPDGKKEREKDTYVF